jgi:hypothetical protein
MEMNPRDNQAGGHRRCAGESHGHQERVETYESSWPRCAGWGTQAGGAQSRTFVGGRGEQADGAQPGNAQPGGVQAGEAPTDGTQASGRPTRCAQVGGGSTSHAEVGSRPSSPSSAATGRSWKARRAATKMKHVQLEDEREMRWIERTNRR